MSLRYATTLEPDLSGHKSILARRLARFRISEEDIDDIIQNTLVNYWLNQQGGEVIDCPIAFLWTSARNLALSLLRSRKASGRLLTRVRFEVPESTDGIENLRSEKERRERMIDMVREALREEKTRAKHPTLWMRYVEGRRLKEIARLTQVGIGVASSRVHASRLPKKLVNRIREEHAELEALFDSTGDAFAVVV
jgi:DNA-directed RNA polymerase specialized sigma24 family protein